VQLGEHTGLWGKPNLTLLVEYGKNPALMENETRTIARVRREPNTEGNPIIWEKLQGCDVART
jgi:hypothetical protein